MRGMAYCKECERLNTFELTGYSEPCTHCAGKNFEVVAGFSCVCGEPMRWMHQPPPEPLEWTLEIPQRTHAGEG